MTSPQLSLIVPAYKQAEMIKDNILELLKELEPTNLNYEIIVVVDGDLDNTVTEVSKVKHEKLKIISYSKNKGKSFAIRIGMKHAMGEYIMFLDAGMEIDPEGISMLLSHMEWYEADIIVGSKRHQASLVKYTPTRKILSYGYYYLVKILFGFKVTDTQAGIKVFKKEVLEHILPRMVEERFAGDLEFLAVAQYLGFVRIYDAPIKLNYEFGSISSAATLKSCMLIFLDTLRIFYRMKIIDFYKNPHKITRAPKDLKIISTSK